MTDRYFLIMNKAYLLAAIGAAVLLSGCGSGKTVPAELPEEEIVKGAFSAGASLHDPFMIEGKDGRFYCYGTHMTAAESSKCGATALRLTIRYLTI